MSKKTASKKKKITYRIGVVAALVIALLISNSFKNEEKEYLSRIPNRTSSKELAQELNLMSEKVQRFKSLENKIIEYPERFNRSFVLIPVKAERFGANSSYIRASSCLVFKPKLNQSDYLSMIDDITKLGFGGGYIINNEKIAKDLGSDSYTFYSFSKDNRMLRLNNTASKYKLPARVCLE